MKAADIASARLQSHALTGKKFKTPLEVVRHMGAMQAQDYGQAVWAIGCRLEKPSLAAVEAAIAHGEILRTWPMRGTIHFVPSEDAAWMVKLMSDRPLATYKRRSKMLGLDDDTYETCRKLLQTALAGRKLLSRPAIMQLFEENGVNVTGQRGYNILWYLAQTGTTCIGPMEGKQQTYALLHEWAPTTRALSHEESLRELAIRYVQSHGPVTVQDFATWTKMKVSDIKLALDLAGNDLTQTDIDGTQYWMHKQSNASVKQQRSVHLLPGFDEYLLGYKDRGAVLAPEHAAKVVPGGNGVFFPVLVIDGEICGVWKRTVKKSAVEITVTPFKAPAADRDALQAAAKEYAGFMGLEPKLTVAAL